MSTPQQPELHRSKQTPEMDRDNMAGRLEARQQPGTGPGTGGPVPAANQPGHHPAVDQDKPDPAAVAARLGILDEDGNRRREEDGEEDEDGAHADGGVVDRIVRTLHLPTALPTDVVDLDRVRVTGRRATASVLVRAADASRRAADRFDRAADHLAVDEAAVDDDTVDHDAVDLTAADERP